MIYAIEAKGLSIVKIGYCSSHHALVWRLSAVSTHCPVEPVLLGAMQGTRTDERQIHEDWAHARVRGEWFSTDPRVTNLGKYLEKALSSFEITPALRKRAQVLRDTKRLSNRDSRRPGFHSDGQLVNRSDFVSLDAPGGFDESGEALSFHETIGTGPDQEISVMFSEMSSKVTRAARDGDGLWEIIRLRGEGFTFEEIAQEVGKDPCAVRKAYSRAQKKLTKKAA